MPLVRLRPVRPDDSAAMVENRSEEADPWNFFGFHPTNESPGRHGPATGAAADAGLLAVESTDGVLIGEVSWNTVQHGPSSSCRALNIGITLFGDYRGRGYGTAAQRALADYLFDTTRTERLEAATDIENFAEQRALEKSGFQREGVLRHAQFRAGAWRDVVLYSRLRHDEPAGYPSTASS